MATGETQIPSLPDDLMAEIAQVAHAQDRQVGEVVADALRKYLDERKWQKVILSARGRAKAMGLTEDDVPRLIAESRAEQGR